MNLRWNLGSCLQHVEAFFPKTLQTTPVLLIVVNSLLPRWLTKAPSAFGSPFPPETLILPNELRRWNNIKLIPGFPLGANYVPSWYGCLKIKIPAYRHLWSTSYTFENTRGEQCLHAKFIFQSRVASFVSDVKPGQWYLWIMNPLLSRADGFNFLSIVMSYLIRLLLVFYF